MTEAAWDRSRCSVAGTLAVVGEKWSLLVLREAFYGVRRFADLQRALGAPRAVLTDRLATLVEEGLLRRVPYQAEGERQRHEYRLTQKGLDLYPTLVALMEWGDRYLQGADAGARGPAGDGAPPVRLEHRECGSAVRLALVCAAGHEVSGPREVRPVPAARAAAGRPA
jgi:DNA-binding HxlR family transcriptional regulator